MGEFHVHTHATDAARIARDIKPALERTAMAMHAPQLPRGGTAPVSRRASPASGFSNAPAAPANKIPAQTAIVTNAYDDGGYTYYAAVAIYRDLGIAIAHFQPTLHCLTFSSARPVFEHPLVSLHSLNGGQILIRRVLTLFVHSREHRLICATCLFRINRLCVPKTRSGRNDDAVHRELHVIEWSERPAPIFVN
jgi:hypothetical protein